MNIKVKVMDNSTVNNMEMVIDNCQVQRDARTLSQYTPGVEPVSDRRKRHRAEPADSKEAACCGRAETS